MRRTLPITLALLLSLVFPALGQTAAPSPGMEELFSYGDNYFIEATALPGTVPGKGRALVSFRLSYDLLTFHKVAQAFQKDAQYVAVPTIYVEAVAMDGVISDRGKWEDTARAADFAQTNSKNTFITGAVDLALRPGVYTIKYTFDDGTPGSGFSESIFTFRMDDFSGASPAVGTPLFLRDVAGDTLTAASIDGNAMFGRRLLAYVPLASSGEPKSLRFELLDVGGRNSADPKVVQTGLGTFLGSATLGPAMPSGDEIRFAVRHDASVPPHAYAAMIDASIADLETGDYMLVLNYDAADGSVTDSVRFKLRWIDIPVSLSRVDYAIKVLYPIVSDDSLDAMLSGDREHQTQALRKFWEDRDPTPDSKYNEAMAEYYRRVDYAFFNFRALGQRDGAFTDRGKIYILYGPPTEVNRELQPDSAPREVWLYHNKVNRGFVFTDPSKAGDYRLTEYYDL
jgi:GWxTD domain-containing protein